MRFSADLMLAMRLSFAPVGREFRRGGDYRNPTRATTGSGYFASTPMDLSFALASRASSDVGNSWMTYWSWTTASGF